MADYIHIDRLPKLRRPILLTAFEGWNDASEVATGALRSLMKRWSGEQFARFDPEEFYDFTETRPMVVYDDDGQRSVTWPENSFAHCTKVQLEHDIVLFLGTEPQLKWRTYTDQILDVARQLDVTLVVSVGGLLADVPHTAPPVITGSATEPALRDKLLALGTTTTRYQGPTGIVGVLQDACRRHSMPAGSIWGSVPHYLRGTVPNPPVQTALLRTLSNTLELGLDLAWQDRQSARFRRQVDEAVSDNEALAEHIKELEQRVGGHQAEQIEQSPLPSGEEFVRGIEDFLRRQNRQQGDQE